MFLKSSCKIKLGCEIAASDIFVFVQLDHNSKQKHINCELFLVKSFEVFEDLIFSTDLILCMQ